MAEKRKISQRGITVLLCCCLAAVSVVAVCVGRYPVSLKELAGILAGQIINTEPFWTPVQEALIINHRLPRVVLAGIVGCCLAAAGSAYQGVFRNPMAAPDILGASSGAAFGAALAILLGMGSSMIVAMAFGCSMLTVAVVIYTAGKAKGRQRINLVLAGVMMGSLVSSGTSLIKIVADPADQLPEITYWLMGSLNGTTPADVLAVAVPVTAGLIPLWRLRWKINILTLGDDEARTMGVNAALLRNVVIISATLITATCVSVCGVIGWVGLVIPHMARKLTGNDYRRLLPASMIMGAIFMLVVDSMSRNMLAVEIPVGILTGFTGVPFFIWLITKGGENI